MKLKNLWTALLTLAAVFMLASCDKEEGNTTYDQLLGKWTLLLQENTITDTQGGQHQYSDSFEPGQIVFDFRADGIAPYIFGPELDTLKWVLNGDQILFGDQSHPDIYRIKKLDEQLILEYTKDYKNIGRLTEVTTFERY